MRIPPSSVAILPLNHGHANQAAKPENAQSQGEQTAVPPGLERVLARLQSLSNPNAGQSNATDRICRNLARYTDTQAISTAPVASAGATTQASAPADAPVSGVVAAA